MVSVVSPVAACVMRRLNASTRCNVLEELHVFAGVVEGECRTFARPVSGSPGPSFKEEVRLASKTTLDQSSSACRATHRVGPASCPPVPLVKNRPGSSPHRYPHPVSLAVWAFGPLFDQCSTTSSNPSFFPFVPPSASINPHRLQRRASSSSSSLLDHRRIRQDPQRTDERPKSLLGRSTKGFGCSVRPSLTRQATENSTCSQAAFLAWVLLCLGDFALDTTWRTPAPNTLNIEVLDLQGASSTSNVPFFPFPNIDCSDPYSGTTTLSHSVLSEQHLSSRSF